MDFVQALCDVSWEEIQSSGLSQHPRLFSLQKLVDISYYNMTRIRLEWSNLWDILGEHFNLVRIPPTFDHEPRFNGAVFFLERSVVIIILMLQALLSTLFAS